MQKEYNENFILTDENIQDLYNQFKNQNELQDTQNVNRTEQFVNNESLDDIIDIEFNPLPPSRYKKLEDLNLLKKENYKNYLKKIRREKNKKRNKTIINIDLTQDEESFDSDVTRILLNRKFERHKNKKWNHSKRKEFENCIIDLTKEVENESHSTRITNSISDNQIPLENNPKEGLIFKNNSLQNLFLYVNNSDQKFNDSERNSEYQEISITSYNILSQQFLKKKKFIKVNKFSLQNRMKTISENLKLISSDIICLQEVDLQALNKHLINSLKNYSFYYAQNYGSFFTNVIGFKSAKFNLVGVYNLNLKGIEIKSNRGVFKMILEIKTTNLKIAVYNIHLPWKPKYLFHKFEILKKISEDILSSDIENIFIAGDFNSTPDSILLKLLYDKHFINEKNLRRNINISNKRKLIMNNINDSDCGDSYDEENLMSEEFDEDQKRKIVDDDLLFENFKKIFSFYNFKSGYQDYKILPSASLNKPNFEKNHPEFTYFTENFRNTIDYIFYSKNFKLKKILKIPSREEVSSEGFLPSSKFPSDHLMIYAEFGITPS
jgi:mRNA deadenylase 3'-5' endonuclease subunit Ccr4